MAVPVDQSQDENIGSAQGQGGSATQVLATLAPVAIFAAVWAVLFLVFRKWFARNYRPRTFLGSLRPNERTPAISNTFFGWLGEFYQIPDTWILNHHTLDGYLFLRFLKISVVICLVGCAITWPVLFPVNITGGGDAAELDILTFSNISTEGVNGFKYFAHAGCAIIFFSFVIYMITRESIYFINLRQAYLMSPFYTSRISSRTVLFTSVPEEYMDERILRKTLGSSVKRVWMAQDVEEVEEKVEERDKAAMKLEAAETKLIVTANKNRLKEEKKGERSSSNEGALEAGGIATASRYLSPKQRPSHKLKPLIGKKVDTIEWCRAELRRLVPEVDSMQREHMAGRCNKLNSVFVEFTTCSEAQAAYQSLTHHQVLQMAPRFIGMTPEEVIWKNLRIKWWERLVRRTVTTGFVVALIIFWSIPVAVVGAISNVDNIIEYTKPAFDWLNDIPPQIMGVVTGLLPVILLAVLMSLLPIILRLVAKLSGDPTTSQVELTVQNYYFGFQVVQVFLVATLGSAATAVVERVSQAPQQAPAVLAENIPKASNFYLCYFVLQGLGVVSGVLVGLVGLVLFMLLGKLLDKTPRKMYQRWISLSGIGWGTLFPVYTNLLVIAICYSVVAPLVLMFAAIGLYLFYFAYRYNLMFVSNANIDTKGQIYPRALQQLFVGLYIAEVCLVGLFAIATGETRGALGPLILMIFMLIFTALYNIALKSALDPLLSYLPKSLDAEERSLLEAERNGVSGDSIDAEKIVPKEHPPHKKPNFITKFLRPDIYTDYHTMRRLVPKDVPIEYTQQGEVEAYFHPAVTNRTPLLWIPRDPVGMSLKEVNETNPIIPITDEGAYLDDKNKVVWDAQDGRPPIYTEKVYY